MIDRLSAGARDLKRMATVVLVVLLLALPLIVSEFWVTEIASKSLWMGIIALSLIFLVKYGGMISFAQLATAGIASYAVAYLTFNEIGNWLFGVVFGIIAAIIAGLLFGLISARTEGIYLLMITLALGMLVFFFANQNCEIFNCHRGIGPVPPPKIGPFDLKQPNPFYYVSLVSAAAMYGLARYVARSPFGLAIQGIRDNPRRMRSLGYAVLPHKVAAFGFAGLIAGVGGILMVWQRLNMSPALIDLTRNIDILVVAVIGGVIYLGGGFVGAVFFTVADTFTAEYFTRERFNTVIGLVFVVLLLVSPNGLLGIRARVRELLKRGDPPPEEEGPLEQEGVRAVGESSTAETQKERNRGGKTE